MAKLNKFVFTLSNKKEISLSNADALELYNELDKIFGKSSVTSATSKTFNFGNIDTPWYPNDDSYITFNGSMMPNVDSITLSNSMNEHPYDWPTASVHLHNVKGVDGVYGATLDDSITLTRDLV
jgi:hypothetical protein